MKKVIVLASVLALAVLGSIYIPDRTAPVSSEDSPAFRTLLGQAIARLEGAPQKITAASVGAGVAHAGDRTPTVDEYTCSGFRTCDFIFTCDGTYTCDGEETCWASTCVQAPTCECGCEQYTLEGGETCDGTDTCTEGCPGWPTYFPGWPTCTGEATCAFTCPGYVSCSGGGATQCERTTWGQLKEEFSE
jgi:hypothetical protein